MQKDNLIDFKKRGAVTDLLTETLRFGARQLLAAAVEAEVAEFIAQNNIPEGKARFVRNGYLPSREIQTGIGSIAVQVPRIRDRSRDENKINFGSSLIPKYLRRSTSMNEFLPLLYLKGISSNDFVEALMPLIGDNAKNLSPGVISRLKSEWEDEYKTFQKQDLSKKRYIYFWADGIHLHARMENSAECVLEVRLRSW